MCIYIYIFMYIIYIIYIYTHYMYIYIHHGQGDHTTRVFDGLVFSGSPPFLNKYPSGN